MEFYSTNNRKATGSFRDAVIQGLAPDGGLYMPETIEAFPPDYFKLLPEKEFPEVAFDIAKQLLQDSIPHDELKRIINKAVNFEAPLVEVENQIYSLELFHGPTLAFKDFGARFLAGLMEYFALSQEKEIVVLAATSGDTGSAVANGFLNAKGVRVIILYPSKKVSPLQEKQLTTLGGNITAWEVDGTFDDCQSLVKSIFLDQQLRNKFLLTSANSINMGRLLPQTFYYFRAWSQLASRENVVFSVPSGNFGNLTAGVIAKRLGLPVSKFIASTNANDIVPAYLISGVFAPRASEQTISNAMDVGNPSNFARLLDLYQNDRNAMAADIKGYSFSDENTQNAILRVFRERNYLMDPHGAVGYLGLKKYTERLEQKFSGVFFETAHPGKFSEVVEQTIDKRIELPEKLAVLKDREKKSVRVSNKFEDAKALLMES